MEAVGNLIMGDPVYDCKGRVVRRNFGIKNIVIILAIVYGLYSLRGKMAIKSGRGKLRGGERVSGPADITGDIRSSGPPRDNFVVKKWNSIFGKHSGIVAAALFMLISLVVSLIIGIEEYA